MDEAKDNSISFHPTDQASEVKEDDRSITRWIVDVNEGHASHEPANTQDRFTALPNELLGNIVSMLPVREICCLRIQNRRLRDFIDTNEGYLVKDIISCHRGRIERDYELLTKLAGVDIADALERYSQYYGQLDGDLHGPDHIILYAVAVALASSWVRAKAPNETKWLNDMRVLSSCHTFASLLWRYRALHESQYPSRSAALLQGINFKVQQDRTFAVADMENFLEKVPSATSGSGSPAHRTKYSTAPWHCLTKRMCKPGFGRLGGEHAVQMARLQTLLDLPVLPADHSLAYCINEHEAVALLEGATRGPSIKLKQAVLAEKLFIW